MTTMLPAQTCREVVRDSSGRIVQTIERQKQAGGTEQAVLRDASGRIAGTATTRPNSGGSTAYTQYRDASGRMTGSASTYRTSANTSRTTYRDASGRADGSATTSKLSGSGSRIQHRDASGRFTGSETTSSGSGGTVSLFSLLTPAKDYLLAGAVKLWFNQNLNRYGQMTQIRIDSKNHRIDVELLLRGESSPIQLALKNYELSFESGETFIAIGEIETSREWINQLISDYLPPDQQRYKVPGALKMLL